MGLPLLLNEQAKGTEWWAQRYWMSSTVKIFRLPFEGLLLGISFLVILEPSCKVIKEMLFRIVLSSVDHLPSRSAYIFLWKSLDICSFSTMYSHPVYSMHLDISPLASWFCFSRLYTPFLSAHILRFSRLIYSVSPGSYSVSVASFTRFPYSSTHFLVWKCPFCPASRKVSSILRSSTFPTSFPFSLPRQSLRAIFFRVLPYLFHCALPSSFLPCSRLPHLVINRVLLPIPVHVGRLKAQ